MAPLLPGHGVQLLAQGAAGEEHDVRAGERRAPAPQRQVQRGEGAGQLRGEAGEGGGPHDEGSPGQPGAHQAVSVVVPVAGSELQPVVAQLGLPALHPPVPAAVPHRPAHRRHAQPARAQQPDL